MNNKKSCSLYKKVNRSRKVEKRWSYGEDKDLIEMVEERESIWNNSSELYAMRELKNQNWEEIANRVEHSVTDCKNRWNSIRSRFNKERTFQGDRTDFKSTYQFYNSLKFLNYILGRPPVKTLQEWTKEAVLEMIELWREHECLYNNQHYMYYEKSARAQSLEKIAEDMTAKGFTVTASDIKTKMCFLRGHIHKPEAYWSEKLNFLQGFLKVPKQNKRPSINTVDTQQNSLSSYADSDDTYKKEYTESEDDDPLEQYAVEKLQPPNKIMKNNTSNDSLNCINPGSLIIQDFNATNNDNSSTNRDCTSNDTDAFSKYITTEMLFITDADLQDEMRHNIIQTILGFKKRQRSLNFNNNKIINSND